MRRPNLMMDVQGRDDRQFRRGAVMGLTLAEIFLLLSFILMLLLGLLIAQRSDRDAALSDLASLDRSTQDRLVVLHEQGWLETVEDAQRRNLTPEALRSVLQRAPQEIPETWERLVRGQSASDPKPGNTEAAERLISLIEAATPQERDTLLSFLEQDTFPNIGDLARFKEEVQRSALPPEMVDQLIDTIKEPQRLGRMLAVELSESLGQEIGAFGGSIDPESGSVTLDDAVLFPQGQMTLVPKAKVFLARFCEPWLTTVHRFQGRVSDVLIEGHASSEWAPGTSVKEAFVKNLALSQGRSAAVLSFCLDELNDSPVSKWARTHLVAVGHSSARPVLEDGIEDPARSRRVVFGVRTRTQPTAVGVVNSKTEHRPVTATVQPGKGTLAAAHARPVKSTYTGFARVVDGDTLDLDGERIRLLGVDAFELTQDCESSTGQRWPCGAVAGYRLAQLIDRTAVRCQSDGRDPFARVLARCTSEHGDLGGWLIDEGLAIPSRDAGPSYGARADRSRVARQGAWAGQFDAPSDWRARGKPR